MLTSWEGKDRVGCNKEEKIYQFVPHHKYQYPQKLLLLRKSVQVSEKHKKAYVLFICEI